jgi:hypothetical protein
VTMRAWRRSLRKREQRLREKECAIGCIDFA